MNAIIFDFDGTIADSFEQVLEFLCSQSGRDIATISPDERRQLRGLSMKDLALKVGVPAWRLPITFFRGKSRMSRHMRRIQPFDGIAEVLNELHSEQYKLFIISSNSKRNISRFLTEHGMGGYFVAVYGNAGWLSKSRTARKLMDKYRLKPEATVYIGDEMRDIIAARVAGMPSVAVSWGFGSEQQLLQHNPTVLVRKPKELQKTLVDWGRAA